MVNHARNMSCGCAKRRAWQPAPVLLSGESPWAEEPGGLQSMGLQRVGHDWVTEQHQSAKKKKGGKIHSHLVARSKEKFSKNMADLPYVINKTCLTDTSVTGPQRSLRCIMIFKHTRTFATIKGYALKETSKIINGLQLYVYSQTKRI